METALNKLKLPFFIIIAIAAAIALLHISTSYNNYWQGRLAKARYMKEFAGSENGA